MEQPFISVSDLPSTLKIARQNAALGMYQDSLKSYRKAYSLISSHLNTIPDPFLADQWKKTRDDISKEMTGVDNLLKSCQILKGNQCVTNSAPDKFDQISEDFPQLDAIISNKPAFDAPNPRILQRFGSKPFHKEEDPIVTRHSASRENQNDFKENANNVFVYMPKPKVSEELPKKDPDVWDPPSPRPEPKRRPPRNLPNWAKPAAHGVAAKPPKQKIGGGGAGSGVMSGMGGNVNYKYFFIFYY